jgi:hypothetical protein
VYEGVVENGSQSIEIKGSFQWWAQQDSNLRPKDYESQLNIFFGVIKYHLMWLSC